MRKHGPRSLSHGLAQHEASSNSGQQTYAAPPDVDKIIAYPSFHRKNDELRPLQLLAIFPLLSRRDEVHVVCWPSGKLLPWSFFFPFPFARFMRDSSPKAQSHNVAKTASKHPKSVYSVNVICFQTGEYIHDSGF